MSKENPHVDKLNMFYYTPLQILRGRHTMNEASGVESFADFIAKVFCSLILLSLVISVGSGPILYVEAIRLCLLGMVGMFFIFIKFPKHISRKFFKMGLVGFWLAMLVTSILSGDVLLVMFSTALFLYAGVALFQAYLSKILKNPA